MSDNPWPELPYVGNYWSHGTRNHPNGGGPQLIVHRADAKCGGMNGGNVPPNSHPLSALEVDHLHFERGVVWPCQRCCPHLQERVTA